LDFDHKHPLWKIPVPAKLNWTAAPCPCRTSSTGSSASSPHPGQCVPYDVLYRDIWGDIIVEDNQMHYQKRTLIKRLAAASPAWETLITTVPKRGFTLNPEQVCLRMAASCAA